MSLWVGYGFPEVTYWVLAMVIILPSLKEAAVCPFLKKSLPDPMVLNNFFHSLTFPFYLGSLQLKFRSGYVTEIAFIMLVDDIW